MNEKDYIGKLVLLGLTFENETEGWSEQHQLHGRVRSFRSAFMGTDEGSYRDIETNKLAL